MPTMPEFLVGVLNNTLTLAMSTCRSSLNLRPAPTTLLAILTTLVARPEVSPYRHGSESNRAHMTAIYQRAHGAGLHPWTHHRAARGPAVLGTTPTDARQPLQEALSGAHHVSKGRRGYVAEEFWRTPRLRKIRLTVLWLMAYRSASSRVVTPARNSDANRHTPGSPSRSMTRCCTRVPSAERTLTRTDSPASPTLRRSTALTSSDTRSTCFE